MTMLLVAEGNQTFEVEQLTDVAPDWQGIKVMAKSGEMKLAKGTPVKLQADDPSLSGEYTVSFCLAPGAPRTWRVLLERAGQSGSARPARSSDLPNVDKLFTIRVSGVIGKGVRRSVVEYKVPFSRLSQEVSRITKAGGTIVSLAESATVDPF